MRTIPSFSFRFVEIRSRITPISIALTLFLLFSMWSVEHVSMRSLEHAEKVNAAPMAASSGFLYVLNDCSNCPNLIFGFAVDETTGTLTPLTNGFPVPTGGNGIANSRGELLTIDRNNLRLFVINDGSNTVSAFSIVPATGALNAISEPINLNSGLWVTSAVHSSCLDSVLVVGETTNVGVNTGRLASLKITATTGTQVSVETTGTAHPFTVVFSQDGSFVYTGGASGSSTFAGFSIDASGTLQALNNGVAFNTFQIDPAAYASDVKGRLFMASRSFHQLKTFRTASGIPTLVQTFNQPAGSQLGEPGQGVLVANDKFYVVSDRSAGSNLLGSYQITGADSNPTLTQPLPLFHSGGKGIALLSVNREGTLLFALNASDRSVSTLRVDANTGSLTLLQTQPNNTLRSFNNGMAYLPPSGGVTINPTVTTIDPPAPITCGQVASIVVKVTSPAVATVPGDVSLTVDGGPPDTQPLINGTATFSKSGLTVGNHSLVANFRDQNCFAASSSPPGMLVVNAASTSITIDAPDFTLKFPLDAPPIVTQTAPVTVTVVTPSFTGTVSGSVSLAVDGKAPAVQPLANGKATFNIVPKVGSRTLIANFSAQGCFGSSKQKGTLNVIKALAPVSTTTTIRTPAGTLRTSSFAADVIVEVTSGAGTPSGNVSLTMDNGAPMTKVISGGKAVFKIKMPAVGNHSLEARFNGTGRFAPSKALGNLVVKPPLVKP